MARGVAPARSHRRGHLRRSRPRHPRHPAGWADPGETRGALRAGIRRQSPRLGRRWLHQRRRDPRPRRLSGPDSPAAASPRRPGDRYSRPPRSTNSATAHSSSPSICPPPSTPTTGSTPALAREPLHLCTQRSLPRPQHPSTLQQSRSSSRKNRRRPPTPRTPPRTRPRSTSQPSWTSTRRIAETATPRLARPTSPKWRRSVSAGRAVLRTGRSTPKTMCRRRSTPGVTAAPTSPRPVRVPFRFILPPAHRNELTTLD